MSDDGDSEFEREAISQDDLHTSTGLSPPDVGEAHSQSFSTISNNKKSARPSPSKPPLSTDTKRSNDVSSDSSATQSGFGHDDDSNNTPSALEAAISPMVHSRTLLLLPLLYMALMPELWWPLQIAAQILLIFVLLTLAVRLTSSPPQMFTKASTEIKLKDIYEQSRTLLSQEHEEIEHSPGSQSTLGAMLLMAVLIALAYLQVTGTLQHFVEGMTMPAVVVPDSGLSPASAASDPLFAMCTPGSGPEFPQECDSSILDGNNLSPHVVSSADTTPSYFAWTKRRVQLFLDMMGPRAAVQSGESDAVTATKERSQEDAGGGNGDDILTQGNDDGTSGGRGAATAEDSRQVSGTSGSSPVSSDDAPSSVNPRLSGKAEHDEGKSIKDTPLGSSAKASTTPNTTTASSHMKGHDRGYSLHVGVDAGDPRHYLTPVGVGYLVPGGNVTFCAPPAPPRASIWRHIFRRHKREANEESAIFTGANGSDSAAADNTNETECLMQVLTIDVSGLVVVRKVAQSTKSDPDLTTTTTANTVSISRKGRIRYNIVWKGNLFPLWKRALRKFRLKRLPAVSLPYSLTDTSLTIWKGKKTTEKAQDTESESLTGQKAAAGQDEWMRGTKPWKLFQVQAS